MRKNLARLSRFLESDVDKLTKNVLFPSFYVGALNKLKQLRIWRIVTGWSQARYELNPMFRVNLKTALCGGYDLYCNYKKT